jgi:hypothetical protein
MVQSVLDPAIHYSETPEIDPTDVEFEANLYETAFYKIDTIFALGKPKYTYIDNNIVYYSIYLVENDEITMQLGVYEILASEQENIVDTDGDIDLNKFAKPLLFEFAYTKIAPKKTEKSTKKGPSKSKWIKEYLDEQYDIIDTPYDGNCFFSAIELALAETEKETSVAEMRDLVADNATEELYQTYKMLYESIDQGITNLTREIKNITKRHTDLTATMKKTKDRNLLMSFDKQSTAIEKLHATLKSDRLRSRENLKEFAFMKGIDNLSMLKLIMKTNKYWADTYAISTLEREMNLKFVIFSELYYREHDQNNVLQCGHLTDTILEERGIFEPSNYILVAYHGASHYQLITYNEQKAFSFAELPSTIKDLVVDKCLEKIAGPYSLIPDFRALKNAKKEVILIDSDSAEPSAQQAEPSAEKAEPSAEKAEPSAEKAELSSDLYNSGTVLRFYSNSADKPLPGKGSGEILGPEGADAYAELARIPHWRKKLGNSWPAEFKLDNHKWYSVEHYYQAAKFKRNNKEFYIQFSVDSPNSSIAKDVEMAIAAGGKSGKFKGDLVRPKNVNIDPDFYQKPPGVKFSRGEIEMEAAMRAKFSQHPDLKQLLLATQKAKLEHIQKGAPATVYNDLMRVRRELKSDIKLI